MTYVLAREVLARAVGALGREGIPLMPLKGVWLQATLYDPPESRAITDVDVLVPEARYGDALQALEADGFVREQHNVSEAALTHPDLPLQLDVHRRLFLPGAFRLPTREVFARARDDRETFGVPVWAPDARDLLAHLIGHFVKSRARPGESAYHEDFRRILESGVVDPGVAADHLQRAGMARATRYALAHNVGRGESAACGLLQALDPDPTGELLCAACLRLVERFDPRHPLGVLPGYLLDRSVPAALAVAARRATERTLATRSATT